MPIFYPYIKSSTPSISFSLKMDNIKAQFHYACESKHTQNAQHYISQFSESAKTNPRSLLYASLFFIALIWFSTTAIRRLHAKSILSNSGARTPDVEKPSFLSPNGSGPKSKFAMESPGGTVPNLGYENSFANVNSCSVEAFLIQAPCCESISKLVPRKD